ncbi:unnamed protein product, partial [Chrysoparadoxa australica]
MRKGLKLPGRGRNKDPQKAADIGLAIHCSPVAQLDDLRGQATWEEDWNSIHKMDAPKSELERKVTMLTDLLTDSEGLTALIKVAQDNAEIREMLIATGDGTGSEQREALVRFATFVEEKAQQDNAGNVHQRVCSDITTHGDEEEEVDESPRRKQQNELEKAEAERNKRQLRELALLDGNDECADCGAREPTWASSNLGIFLCTQCSGCHRGLGVHISVVLSCQLDRWESAQVHRMTLVGNKLANSYWEHHVPHEWPKPNEREQRAYRESYIRAKYAEKLFCYRIRKPPVMKVMPPEEKTQPNTPIRGSEVGTKGTKDVRQSINSQGMIEYVGFVNIKLCRGVSLLPMGVIGQRQNNYMAILRIGQQEVRSKTIKSDTNPVWDEDIMLCWDGEAPLNISVWSGQEHVGQAEVELGPLLASGAEEQRENANEAEVEMAAEAEPEPGAECERELEDEAAGSVACEEASTTSNGQCSHVGSLPGRTGRKTGAKTCEAGEYWIPLKERDISQRLQKGTPNQSPKLASEKAGRSGRPPLRGFPLALKQLGRGSTIYG